MSFITIFGGALIINTIYMITTGQQFMICVSGCSEYETLNWTFNIITQS